MDAFGKKEASLQPPHQHSTAGPAPIWWLVSVVANIYFTFLSLQMCNHVFRLKKGLKRSHVYPLHGRVVFDGNVGSRSGSMSHYHKLWFHTKRRHANVRAGRGCYY